jgi:hypothetical protein
MAYFANKAFKNQITLKKSEITTLEEIENLRNKLRERIYEWEKYPGDNNPKPDWLKVMLLSEFLNKEREKNLQIDNSKKGLD